MILSGQTIRRLCVQKGMIEPFMDRTISHGRTYGLSACGYDIRIKQHIVLPPNSFRLASSIEFFKMPTNVAAVVMDKSSLARMGLTVFNTFIEPGWNGYLTLELKNLGDLTLELHAESPIAQIVFHYLDFDAVNPYDGKYQNQADEPVKSIYEHPH